jgi:hypothetical protein
LGLIRIKNTLKAEPRRVSRGVFTLSWQTRELARLMPMSFWIGEFLPKLKAEHSRGRAMTAAIEALLQMQSRLAGLAEHVSIRGSGAGSFLFARNRGRAVEISDDEGIWWIEQWDLSEDEDASPCAESRLERIGEAIELAIVWLFG